MSRERIEIDNDAPFGKQPGIHHTTQADFSAARLPFCALSRLEPV
jgi:hypothetical protein